MATALELKPDLSVQELSGYLSLTADEITMFNNLHRKYWKLFANTKPVVLTISIKAPAILREFQGWGNLKYFAKPDLFDNYHEFKRALDFVWLTENSDDIFKAPIDLAHHLKSVFGSQNNFAVGGVIEPKYIIKHKEVDRSLAGSESQIK